MTPVENLPPRSLGLWGDGDEIAAIRDVERTFAVQLDYSDARNWVTAGDVFAAFRGRYPLRRHKMLALGASLQSPFRRKPA